MRNNFFYFVFRRFAEAMSYQGLVLSVLLISQSSYAQDTNKKIQLYKCVIKFKLARAEVDKKALNKCVSQFNISDIDHIKIFTTYSPEGSLAFNQKLSEKRAQNIIKQLGNIKTKIEISHEGSSAVSGRQGTILFTKADVIKADVIKPLTCPQVPPAATVAMPSKALPPIAENKIVKEVQVKFIKNNDDVYAGLGITFLNSSIAKYVGNTVLSYNVGINHKLMSFSLGNGDSNFYVGGDLQFSNTEKSFSLNKTATSAVTQTSVLYVINNYALIFGMERKFAFYKPLSLFVDAGPAFQERVFIITDITGPTEYGDAARDIGLIGNLGVKLNFLEKSLVLEKVGMDSLFLRSHVSGSYGVQMKTRALPDDSTAYLNGFSWSVFVDAGFTF